jgi:hypothetical protein
MYAQPFHLVILIKQIEHGKQTQLSKSKKLETAFGIRCASQLIRKISTCNLMKIHKKSPNRA